MAQSGSRHYVFKRLSYLSGTKRFYFSDHRQFSNLLHLFCAAVAVLDCIIALLKAHKSLFAALRAGIKGTWRNVCSQIREVLYELPCAFGRTGRGSAGVLRISGSGSNERT